MPALTSDQKLILKHKAQVKRATRRAKWHKAQIIKAKGRLPQIKSMIESVENKISTVKRHRTLDSYKVLYKHHYQQIWKFEYLIEDLTDQVNKVDHQLKYHQTLYHKYSAKYL